MSARHADELEGVRDGAFIDGSAVEGELTAIADFAVIGAGASGAVAAATLTRAGFDVVILEEGPWVRTRELAADLAGAMRSLVRGGSAQPTWGSSSVALLQGRGVGGSTTINSALAMRAPEHVLAEWAGAHRLGDTLGMRALEPHFEALETELNARPVAAPLLAEHHRAFEAAGKRLGIGTERLSRFESGCVGSASCLTGCRAGKKMSMNLTLIPDALRRGARLYSNARVVRVESRAGRATGVTVRLGSSGKLKLYTRRGVIVCASALQTPGVLRRSGLRSSALGRFFQCHPAVSLGARFDRPVHMGRGATQALSSMHFARSHRFKLESISVQPELMAMNIPAIGQTLTRQLEGYDRLLTWGVVVRAEATGRVVRVFDSDQVWFSPTRVDLERARHGLKVLSEMMFAAGAREVWPGVHGMPASLRSADQLHLWDSAPLDGRAYPFIATHLFGTARLGRDPRTSVVGADFQSHELEGLYVLDSSVFPSNLGVNPQLTIMAVARLGAQRIAEQSSLSPEADS